MRRYFAEFNRVVGGNIRTAAKRLNRMGLNANILPHRTSLVIERLKSMPWAQCTAAILAVLQPRRGSVIMSSEYSGRAWICQNGGNRPGHFRAYDPVIGLWRRHSAHHCRPWHTTWCIAGHALRCHFRRAPGAGCSSMSVAPATQTQTGLTCSRRYARWRRSRL
jgi:hypothetical protein